MCLIWKHLLDNFLVVLFQLFAINTNGKVTPISNQHRTGHSCYSSHLVKHRGKQIPKPVELTAEVKFLVFVTGDNNASSVKGIYQVVSFLRGMK